MAFSAGLEAGTNSKHDFQPIKEQHIPLYMLTYFRGLLGMVKRNCYSAERRLMIDMSAISHGRWDIEGTGRVAGVSRPV